jgi:hypothetical protein
VGQKTSADRRAADLVAIRVVRTSVAVAVAVAIRLTVAFAARATHRPAQELRLLVVRLREARFAPAHLVVRRRLLPWALDTRVGGLLWRRRLEVARLAAAVGPAILATVVPAIWPAIWPAIIAVMPVVVVMAIAAIPEALLVVATAVPLETRIVHARLRVVIVLAHRLHRRLQIAFITVVVAELIARLQATAAIHAIAPRSHMLVAEGHDDAVIMLGVLEIILGHHAVSGRTGITRELQIFLIDMGRGAANFDVGPGRVKSPVMIVLRSPAAPS